MKARTLGESSKPQQGCSGLTCHSSTNGTAATVRSPANASLGDCATLLSSRLGFELKYDGWRCLAELDGGNVRLQSRGGHNATRWWPEIVAALAPLPGHHILDGEMCVLDDLGRSDFERLQKRSMLKGWKPAADLVVYCVFDILLFDGRDVMSEPLDARRNRLAELLKIKRPGAVPPERFKHAKRK